MDPLFDFPGWNSATDPRTGRQYYINVSEKTTTWEDPRIKYKNLYGQAIPLQPMHGSPYHVYPTQNYPTHAFQNPGPGSFQGHSSINASPLLSTKSGMNQQHHLEMSSLSRSSPHTPRVGQLIKHQQLLQQQQLQETSFIHPTAIDTDATVAKINSMFPTASDPHIRLLLKKYHNREAVVISALQVEKHPLTTPGPYTTPPPPCRHFHTTAVALSAFQMTPPSTRKGLPQHYGDHVTLATTSSISGSPIPPRPQSSTGSYYGYYGSPRIGQEHYRCSPKPHSSPKMKLRYLKSLFQKAEETVILDVLANVDNNVQKASDQLIRMGFEKKDMAAAPRLSNRKKEEQAKRENVEPTPPPKPKTAEEKKKLKTRLQTQYKDIAERIISMALESVDYSEDKACRILDIVIQEDKETKMKTSETTKKKDTVEKNVSFKEVSANGKNVDLNDAAAVENDETMIINSDNTIITTPIESPRGYGSGLDVKSMYDTTDAKIESDTPTSETSTCSMVDSMLGEQKQKKHCRPKMKKETHAKVNADGVKVEEKSVPEKTVFADDVNVKKDEFKSLYARTVAVGPNPKLQKGPKDNLLLADYVAWNGANPDISVGRKVLAKGANPALLIDRTYKSRGSTNDLCKGAKVGLAKGSIYGHRNVACN